VKSSKKATVITSGKAGRKRTSNMDYPTYSYAGKAPRVGDMVTIENTRMFRGKVTDVSVDGKNVTLEFLNGLMAI